MIYAAVGVHPGHSVSWNDQALSELRELSAHPKTVAIGEIGLDYFRDHAPREHQREVLSIQLQLAAEMGLPVVLHNRDSFQDLWLILSGWLEQLSNSHSVLVQHPGVLHSYDGDLVSALEAVKHGFFIGVSGPVTFKNAVDRQQVVAGMPLDHVLIETDAPYLTPSPHRGKWPNEPAFTTFIVEKVAALHNLSIDYVRKATAENAARLFAWEL
jgi:TatD DNase family protein